MARFSHNNGSSIRRGSCVMIDGKATPCVGLCSTVYGDDVCRGCKRFYHEIIDWNQYDINQKQKNLVALRAAYCRDFAAQNRNRRY
ncbi:DUF1289 domain-containing protein [Piscirickettsia litoralis]|uniref:DUF1289 domain-containing protein n=1 Tax=Piscirickettsia litoralis TaxID=1891921 RepID=UPI00293953F1|nr:DUF1289 domain-containing protein [Piscirickettsia litoralis]